MYNACDDCVCLLLFHYTTTEPFWLKQVKNGHKLGMLWINIDTKIYIYSGKILFAEAS